MFKVPVDPHSPTYDSTFTVGFWQWLTSSKAERMEWRRRKNLAIPTSPSLRKIREREQAARERRSG